MDPLTDLELEPLLLLLIITGLSLADGPVVLQMLWLFALAVGAWRVLRAHRAGVNAPSAS